MKILYIGNFKDGTGWSNASIGYILSLDAVGINVVPRCLKLNNYNGKIPTRVLELEQQSDKDCDIVIQHVLPHMLSYDGRFRQNISIFASETDQFKLSGWHKYLNMMNQVWVINQQQREASINSGVRPKISIVPHACDTTLYERSYPKLDIPELNGKFVFYFVGEHQPRKNLIALLKAFHLEFRRYEPVGLVIKTNAPGKSDEQLNHEVSEVCQNVKKMLKLNKCHSEIIITKFLNDEELLCLHNTCDCLVMPSYGEAWGLPLIDSMGLGKSVIATDYGGPSDILRCPNGELAGWLVSGTLTNVFGMENLPGLYCGEERWLSIDIDKLRLAMRQCYENKSLRDQYRENAVNRVYDFAYNKVGQLMGNLL